MALGSHFVEWRGHRIHVVDSGKGEPLLLVPGLGNNVDMWKPFMDQFRERRIIRLEAPGTGLSSTPSRPVRIPELSDMLAAILDECGIEWADVVGFSYGGAVAQQFAHDHPARVRRLVHRLDLLRHGVGAGLTSGHDEPGHPAALLLTELLRTNGPDDVGWRDRARRDRTALDDRGTPPPSAVFRRLYDAAAGDPGLVQPRVPAKHPARDTSHLRRRRPAGARGQRRNAGAADSARSARGRGGGWPPAAVGRRQERCAAHQAVPELGDHGSLGAPAYRARGPRWARPRRPRPRRPRRLPASGFRLPAYEGPVRAFTAASAWPGSHATRSAAIR